MSSAGPIVCPPRAAPTAERTSASPRCTSRPRPRKGASERRRPRAGARWRGGPGRRSERRRDGRRRAARGGCDGHRRSGSPYRIVSSARRVLSPRPAHRPRPRRGCAGNDKARDAIGCARRARERVVVAMSGGVDSSVAAARLCDAGYDVVGVTLHLWDYPESGAAARPRPLLRARGSVRRAPRRRRARLSALHVRPPRALRAHVVEPVRRRVPRRRDAEPVHRVQPHREARRALRHRRPPRRGARRDGPLRARRRATPPAQPRLARAPTARRTRATSSTRARARGSSASSSRSATRRRPRSARRPLARALPGARKGESQELCFAGHGAARVRGLRRRARGGPRAPRPDRRRRGTHRRRRTTACIASRSASARGSASRSGGPRS